MPTYKIEWAGLTRLVDAPTPAAARKHATDDLIIARVTDPAEAYALFQQGVPLEKAGEPMPVSPAAVPVIEDGEISSADHDAYIAKLDGEPAGTIGGAQIEGDDESLPWDLGGPSFIGPDDAPRRGDSLIDD